MRVLVTGGCGYKGSVLVPKLLALGHEVTVVDALWFGVHIASHKNLTIIKRDIREGIDCSGQNAIIHLAGIANDPCGELDAKLTWEVNVLAHMQLCEAAVKAGVSQFIYASSASVYGIKDSNAITEEASLEPVSDYNKTKMCAERILLSYKDMIEVKIARPATICGMSPRMRLDTMVNMLTVQALKNGKITAHCGEHGGNLMRPNTHIEDITDLYCWLLGSSITGIWNAGFENLSALDTAVKIGEQIEASIEITTVKDKRSYAVDSSKLIALGFKPKYTVDDAIRQIKESWHSGALVDSDDAYNLKWMQTHGWVRT